ncbi:uncharacterized protein [Macrobrachium rosenbergii]|uniref:uncharacterized protein n=1 Tax=Macrobrachium rosenbergii TaxID=79674 RepID=UPI0034D52ED1
MPPLKPVPSLKSICMEAFASTLAYAFVKAAGGGLTGPAKRIVNRSKKQSSSKKASRLAIAESLLTSNPLSQITKLQEYINKGMPKGKQWIMFHPVILLVTEMVTMLKKGHESQKENYKFGSAVQKLGVALGYAMDTLFSAELKRLDMTSVVHHCMKWVSTCRLNNQNPKDLSSIDASVVENMFVALFASSAHKLECLTHIRWPHLVCGELIKILGRHCHNLRHLELACECDETVAMNDVKEDPEYARKERELVNALAALYDRAPGDFTGTKPPGCYKLQTLVLPRLDDEDGLLAKHIMGALCSLKQLESITGAPMLVSLHMLKNEKKSPSALKLKHLSDIDNYNRRPMPDMSYLKKILPSLNSLEIIVSQAITIEITNAFLDIRALKIQQPDFHNNIRSFKYLDTLDIHLDFQISWPILFAITRGRIQIRDLTLRHSTFQVGQEHHEGFSLKLPSLKSFTLIKASFIEYTAFRSLVKGAPNLVNVSITLTDDRNYVVDEFRDELIVSLAPLMPNLESFTAESLYKYNLCSHLNCLLSLDSANVLIECCPRLKLLGHFDSWDVTDEEINHLNDQITINNWDLQIV